uniref:Uncharacterized protein n=1 Tax=Panagrolaimus sp. PS1159 TaxID=55785 RepID=A0AC35FGG8_9BILA
MLNIFLDSFLVRNFEISNMHMRKVKITNTKEESIYGKIPCDSDFIEMINSLKNRQPNFKNLSSLEWKADSNLPSDPSPLVKRDGVKWYLVRLHDGGICVKEAQYVQNNDYLIAEMQTSGFDMYDQCKIEISDF